MQRQINDPKTDSNDLTRFPNAKRAFDRLNMGAPSSTPAERLLSNRRDVFTIKRSTISDDIIERQRLLSYNKIYK